MTDEPEPWPFFDSDRHAWPPGIDATKLAEAHVEVRKKRTDQEIARARAHEDAEIASTRAHQDHVLAVELEYFKSVLEVAKGSVERARSSAETVQKAAGAIGTIYAAVLGVSFSVAERPFPAEGLIPAVLLGLAIAFSTTFLAYLPDPEDERYVRGDDASSGPRLDVLMNGFIRWSRHTALNPRVNWLRASVVALGAAVALLPAPFVSIGEPSDANASTPAATAAPSGAAPSEEAEIWPLPGDAAPGAHIELRKILYQAQVDDAEAQRDAEPQESGSRDEIWWWAFLVALLLVLFQLVRGRLQVRLRRDGAT